MTEHSTKIYLLPSSVLNTFVKRTPGAHHFKAVYLPVKVFTCEIVHIVKYGVEC